MCGQQCFEDIIRMWRTHTHTRSAAVKFARSSALYVLLLDDHHAMNERVLLCCHVKRETGPMWNVSLLSAIGY